MSLSFRFTVGAKSGNARVGLITHNGMQVETPCFMPVATRGASRILTQLDHWRLGSRILLSNAYHLAIRPGLSVIESQGGLKKFMGWRGLSLTDSGGFQAFSLSKSCEAKTEGLVFDDMKLSPETCLQNQIRLGSDIAMPLDVCVDPQASLAESRNSVRLTTQWLRKTLETPRPESLAVFGIQQGACFESLRRESAAGLLDSGEADGYALGGLAIGETRSARNEMTALANELLPKEKSRYLMGLGSPADLLESIENGMDLFDSIYPISLGQRGVALTRSGRLHLRSSKYSKRVEPVDPTCTCETCAHASCSYLHHLFKSEEPLFWTLLAMHNIHFVHSLMCEARMQIRSNTFSQFVSSLRESLVTDDPYHPVASPKPLWRGRFEIARSPKGTYAIRDKELGETMHSVLSPMDEAKNLYVDQTQLRDRLNRSVSEIVIWDIGMGAATNAVAAIRAIEGLKGQWKFRMRSFETDLDSLKLVSNHPRFFPQAQHPGLQSVLKEQKWKSECGRIIWELVRGDFRELLQQEESKAEIIFYDPFSPKVDGQSWTTETFATLARALSDTPCGLFTYSVSTAVRANLMANGFWVARGWPTGMKSETTVAFTKLGWKKNLESWKLEGVELLGQDWLERWKKSSNPGSIALEGLKSLGQFQPQCIE